MTPLLLTCVCDYCDGLVRPKYDRGFVVFRNRPPGTEEYVFRTVADAEQWRAFKGLEQHPIREVWTESTIRWRKSTGSLRDVELADHRFEIYPDHRFPAGPYRAFLAEAAAA